MTAGTFTVEGYTHHPGHHCETTAFRNVLMHAGIELSEEMLFGLGEGLGFLYWFMKGKKVAMPYPFVGYRGGKVVELIHRAAVRLGIGCKAVETASEDRAYANVTRRLAEGGPVCIYADMAYLPYMRLPEEAHFGGHSITLFEVDEGTGTARVSDCLNEPQTMALDDLRRARGSEHQPFPPKNRHLDLTLPARVPGLEEAVLDAIRSNAESMAHPPISNMGLKGFLKFASEIRKWPRMLGPENLLWAVVNAFVYIEVGGTGGGGFRPMYARFLREARALTGAPRLLDAAALCDRCAEAVSAVGVSLLPDELPSLARLRCLALEKDRVLKRYAGRDRDRRLGRLEEESREATEQALADDVPKYPEHLDAVVTAVKAAHQAEVEANAALLG